jgi:hypothetical protein
MGAKNSKSVQSSAVFLADITTNSIINNQTICKSSTSINQTQDISVDNSGVVALQGVCIAAGQSARDCASLIGSGIALSNVSQDAAVTISSGCQIDSKTQTAVTNDLTNNIMQKIQSSSDDVGDALKSMATAINGKNSSSVDLKTTVQNTINNTFTVNNLQEFVNTIVAGQSQMLAFKNTQSAAFNNISQSLALKATYSLCAKNEDIVNAAATITNQATQEATVSSQVLPGLWSTLQTTLTAWFGSLKVAYLAVGGSVSSLICGIVIIIGVFFFTGGQTTLQQGISAAAAMTPQGAAAQILN